MSDFFSKSEELDPKEFWNNLDKTIKEKDWTLTALCFVAGISETSIRSAKSRGSMPLLSTAYSLSKYLEVSLEYLITGVEPGEKIIEKIPEDLQAVINKYAN